MSSLTLIHTAPGGNTAPDVEVDGKLYSANNTGIVGDVFSSDPHDLVRTRKARIYWENGNVTEHPLPDQDWQKISSKYKKCKIRSCLSMTGSNVGYCWQHRPQE